jgi:energy-coupling factor transporter transmembrane protein EcfT
MYWVLVSLGGLFTLLSASAFYLGSKENAHELIQTQGLPTIFLWRLAGFALLGTVLTIGIVLLSVLGKYWNRAPNWAVPLRVAKLSGAVHLGCAVAGSLLFTVLLARTTSP